MIDDRYPHAPAEGKTDTSAEAAEAIAPTTGRIQRRLLDALKRAGGTGLTAEEASDRLDLPRVAVQPRTTELRLLGKIRDSGQRRPNASGKRAIVWVAANIPQTASEPA